MLNRKTLSLTALCALSLIWLSTPGRAANLTTTNVQGSGANWTAAIWKINTAGQATNTTAAVGPAAGNTYETVFLNKTEG